MFNSFKRLKHTHTHTHTHTHNTHLLHAPPCSTSTTSTMGSRPFSRTSGSTRRGRHGCEMDLHPAARAHAELSQWTCEISTTKHDTRNKNTFHSSALPCIAPLPKASKCIVRRRRGVPLWCRHRRGGRARDRSALRGNRHDRSCLLWSTCCKVKVRRMLAPCPENLPLDVQSAVNPLVVHGTHLWVRQSLVPSWLVGVRGFVASVRVAVGVEQSDCGK